VHGARTSTIEVALPVFLETQQRYRRLLLAGIEGKPEEILVAAYFGGWGSGKSTILKWIAFEWLTRFPGIKVLIVRETFAALNLTTKKEFLERMVEGNAEGTNVAERCKKRWHEETQTYTHISGSSVLFGGLDKVEKWGSTEFGLILIDEGSLIAEDDIDFLLSRLRQKAPPCRECKSRGCPRCGFTGNTWGPDYRRCLGVFSNHVYETHFLYRFFVGGATDAFGARRDAKDGFFYVETSSYENHPDRGGHLPRGYLERLAASVDRRTVSVFMGGKWGIKPEGTPVYSVTEEMNGKPWHFRPTRFDPARPIHRAIDFGYRFPFVTYHQIQAAGRIRTLAEFTVPSSHTGFFCEQALLFESELFPGATWGRLFGDPAGRSERSEGPNDAETVEGVFGLRFESIPSTEQTKANRRKIIQKKLEETIQGEPAYAIDSRRCPTLRNAMLGLYRFPKLQPITLHQRTNYIEKPVEEHPFCDVAHSVEYFFANAFRNLLSGRPDGRPLVEGGPRYRVNARA
jgi:hypothetical protein